MPSGSGCGCPGRRRPTSSGASGSGRWPLEPEKPADRITLVAHLGSPVLLSTYPWINGLSEAQIEAHLRRSASV